MWKKNIIDIHKQKITCSYIILWAMVAVCVCVHTYVKRAKVIKRNMERPCVVDENEREYVGKGYELLSQTIHVSNSPFFEDKLRINYIHSVRRYTRLEVRERNK